MLFGDPEEIELSEEEKETLRRRKEEKEADRRREEFLRDYQSPFDDDG